jgi:Lrp/AsnC family transcriptional regulator for asnA, asnC and gidA
MNKIKIDKTDKKILSFLMKNARMPFLEIARECGISGAAIHQRVKKLENSDVIEGSQFNISPKSIGYDICAYVGVQLTKANLYKDVVQDLMKIPEVIECHFTTGRFAVLIKMFCKNNDHLMEVLVNTIQNIPEISSTETFISLDQAFHRQLEI